MLRPLGSKVAAISAFEVTISICQITKTSAEMIPTPLVSLKSLGRMALAQNFPPKLGIKGPLTITQRLVPVMLDRKYYWIVFTIALISMLAL